MGKPTEKMVYALKKLGYKDEQISLMEYETASSIIGKSKESQFHKEIAAPEVVSVEKAGSWNPRVKPMYNPASQYISYSKDIFLQLREMIHVEIMKPNSKMEVVADEIIMERAINLVKIAIREFE